MADEVTLKIGQEVVRRKVATLEQIRQCLSVQHELAAQGKDVPFGNVLVARGVLTLEDLKEILSGLDLLTMSCASCKTELRIEKYSRQNQYICNRCGGELAFTARRTTTGTEKGPQTGSREVGFKSPEELVGRELGGCLIRRRIASGGMGTVYEAEQVNLGRTVALKVLSHELAEDESFVKRFLQEARSAAALNHTNVIHINDAGQSNGVFYYTMEFVQGENLAQRLRRRGCLPIGEALEITDQVADALAHAHEHEIVHRDVKPENIMITPDGRVKLADLGLAKKVMDAEASTITQAGAILGTPYYMAPEQARDFRRADARSDLYSLGVTLFKMLSGRVPFEGSSPIEVMMRALEGKHPPLSDFVPDLPPEVGALVDRLMHVDPEVRYRSGRSVRAAIRHLRTALALEEAVIPGQ
ncbi:MAG: serine/threonine-protein kinase [Planctomycetota bacterium]